MLTSPSVTATANLSALVGAVVGSIGAVKKLAGRAIAVIRPIAPGRTRVDLEDGNSIEMSQESAQLVNDPAYRRSVRGMVEPLAGNRGIHSLTVSTDGQGETIMTNDYPSFVTAPAAKDDAERALDRLGSAPGVEDGTIPVSQPQPAVAKVEDPREMIDHSYQRQLELLQEVHQAVADVATSRKRVELQMNQLQKSAGKLERQARDSLAVRREDLAREALTRKAVVSDQLNDLQTQYTSLRNAEERITLASQRLQSRVDAFRTKKEVIKALLTAAQAETRINEVLTGISEEMGDVGMANQQAEDRTEQTKARAGAIDELMASGALDDAVGGRRDDIQAELNQMHTGHDVEAELARLKAERGQSAPAQNEGAPGSAGWAPTTGQAEQSGQSAPTASNLRRRNRPTCSALSGPSSPLSRCREVIMNRYGADVSAHKRPGGPAGQCAPECSGSGRRRR